MFRELLQQRLGSIAELSDYQLHAFEAHYELLVQWNRRLNLTSIEPLEAAVERHYCESIFLAVHLPPAALQIADVGSGGGFPGIPVAIMRPDCFVNLIESHSRKAVFLREATRNMTNVRVLAERAEALKDTFDVSIARAVSYSDLIPILKKISCRADLLTGAEAPPEELGFKWAAPEPLPWGNRRFLRMGVSRET